MKKIKKFIRFILFTLLVAAGITTYFGYNKYKKALLEQPLDMAVEEIQLQTNYTALSDIPPIYTDAVVAVEDRRYYYHQGFDIIGTARAIITDIKQKKLVEGGSTITQQLAKNMYFPADNSPTRKIAEIFMALRIEREYSKEEILELYFNGIYFGSGYYNIYDASYGYFGKEPSQLTDYEATMLAGIPNAPSAYSPKNNLGLAEKRQEKVLRSMVEGKYISVEEKDEILAQQVSAT